MKYPHCPPTVGYTAHISPRDAAMQKVRKPDTNMPERAEEVSHAER
jgi:hypothetical protein